MKKISLSLIFLSFIFTCFSQSMLDKEIKSISDDLAGKLKLQNREKLVVLFITDINKKNTTAGIYFADNISYNLVNDNSLTVFERENLSSIAEVKKLIDEGYIDAEKTKKLGKLLSVNAIIIGTYTILSNTVKLSLKALSSDNGATVAASMNNLILDADAGKILGIKILASGENLAQNPDCGTISTGDCCFQNSSNYKLTIEINDVNGMQHVCDVQSGQKSCFYDIPAGKISYEIRQYSPSGTRLFRSGVAFYPAGTRIPEDDGMFDTRRGLQYIETCKSKTFIIK